MFRKLYWVTEQVETNGQSHVTGVYTSIPDLIRHGLKRKGSGRALRLTLTKLDTLEEPLGTWDDSTFGKLEDDLTPYVRTDEFTAEACHALAEDLKRQTLAAA